MATSKPKRSVEEQQFLDIAAIQFVAARISREPITNEQAMFIPKAAFDAAEQLLNERNKRL